MGEKQGTGRFLSCGAGAGLRTPGTWAMDNRCCGAIALPTMHLHRSARFVAQDVNREETVVRIRADDLAGYIHPALVLCRPQAALSLGVETALVVPGDDDEAIVAQADEWFEPLSNHQTTPHLVVWADLTGQTMRVVTRVSGHLHPGRGS